MTLKKTVRGQIMYIGSITEGASLKFYRAGTDIPFEPEKTDDGLVWKWDRVFDSEIDIKYTLGEECFIGDVVTGVTGAKETTLYADGSRIACKNDGSAVSVNEFAGELTIRVRGDLCDIVFSGAEIFGCRPDDEPLMLPRPNTLSFGDSRVRIGSIVAEGEDACFARDFLLDSLKERYAQIPSGEGVALRLELSDGYEAERYTVEVTEGGATVKAASRLGLLWGVCRIIDLWDGGELRTVHIDDKPDVPMRGFHMGLPRADRIEFVKRFFRYVLLPMGYNHVIVEFNGAMRFDRHPEISEKWLEADRLHREGKQPKIQHSEMGADGTLLEKEQVRDLLSVLESYGIEVIPEVQSLGHVQYLTYAHPEIAEHKEGKNEEVDVRKLDALPDDFYDHCYCPSREDSMRYIFDIIDEIIEVARPKRYVHIGHDEIMQIGLCPVCSAKGKAQIYKEHVLALYSHMKKWGLGTMLWSDMLHTDLPYSVETAAALNELPKDIIFLDFTWYFHPEYDIEDEIIDAGHPIIMGNLYSSHYTRYASRIAKKGMIGGEVSTWIAVSEDEYAENGKFFDLVYTAEMLWNAYTYDDRNRAAYTSFIGQCVLPEMRDLIHGRYDLYLAADPEEAELVGLFPGDESRIPEEISYLRLTEPTGELTVGARYDRLIFEHATLHPAPRIAWKPLCTVGRYTVTYEDGESVDIPVKYAGGILCWRSLYGAPMEQKYYRHQGYVGTWLADPTYEARTAEGEPILLLGQPWDNPRPEKLIAHVTYTAEDGDYAALISSGVLGVKLK